MRAIVIAFTASLLGWSAMASAQATNDMERGSIPPGTAQDGSRPSDGAITGGSIMPGEAGGVPGAAKPADRGERCKELSGTLRDQCLLNEQGASTGGNAAPDTGTQKPLPPRVAPPPQNPR